MTTPLPASWCWWEILAAVILLPPMIVGVMVLIGTLLDNAAQYSEMHDRCLKAATNGYAIKQCR